MMLSISLTNHSPHSARKCANYSTLDYSILIYAYFSTSLKLLSKWKLRDLSLFAIIAELFIILQDYEQKY